MKGEIERMKEEKSNDLMYELGTPHSKKGTKTPKSNEKSESPKRIDPPILEIDDKIKSKPHSSLKDEHNLLKSIVNQR